MSTMTYKIKYLILAFALLASLGWAQQNAQYTQYMYNTGVINPGYSVSRGTASLTGLHRSQWVGVDGAPSTQTFNFDTSFMNRNTGLGVAVVNDAAGPAKQTGIAVNYAYRLDLSRNYTLSFGISGSFDFLNVDVSKLIPGQSENIASINESNPNVGVGAFLYSENVYFGLSAPRLLRSTYFDSVKVTSLDVLPHFYAIGGVVFDLSNSVQFKPAVLVKAVSGAPIAADLSANFLFNDKLTLGAAYRWDAAASLLAGFQITDNLLIGYAYDKDTSSLGRYNNGSHEVFIKFNFNRNCANCVIRNTRFF